MDNINFIKSASPKQQQSLQTWYRITFTIVLFTIGCLCILTTWHIYQLFSLKSHVQKLENEVAHFAPIFEQKNKLEKDLNSLIQKKEKAKKLSRRTKEYHILLKSLFKTCTIPIEINSVSIQNGFEKISIFSPDLANAFRFIKDLKKEACIEKLIITSLEPNSSKNGYIISIKQSKKRK